MKTLNFTIKKAFPFLGRLSLLFTCLDYLNGLDAVEYNQRNNRGEYSKSQGYAEGAEQQLA